MNYLSGHEARSGDKVAIGMDNGSTLLIGTVVKVCKKKIKIDAGRYGIMLRDPERVVLVAGDRSPTDNKPVLTSEQIIDIYGATFDSDIDQKFKLLTKDQFLQLLHEYGTTVYVHMDIVDEEDEQDWYSLALGFGLAKGLTPHQAHEFALIERYSANLYWMFKKDDDENDDDEEE